VNATHGITAAQFRSPRQPFQHLPPNQYVITDNMAGVPLDTHYFAHSGAEADLYRDSKVSHNDTADSRGKRVLIT
jgi:hypothetical protein